MVEEFHICSKTNSLPFKTLCFIVQHQLKFKLIHLLLHALSLRFADHAMLRTLFNEKLVHSLSAHHTKVKLKARPFPNQLRDEKELISRGQRSASNINIYISQYAPRTRAPGSCIVRLVSSGTRGEIRYLTRCSKREYNS